VLFARIVFAFRRCGPTAASLSAMIVRHGCEKVLSDREIEREREREEERIE